MMQTYPQSHSYPQDDFHKAVARTLSQGSAPMSMDFHPVQQTLLLGKFFNVSSHYKSRFILCNSISFVQCLLFLVGTNVGDIGLWDVGTKERLAVRNFKVWELGKCSMALQVCLLKYVVQ
jgi:hypothetical protein